MQQNTEIKIDKEGIWYYRGAQMFRKEFLCIFFEHLKIDEQGKYLIELGNERCYVDVEDTVFVVLSVYKARHPEERQECFYIFLTDDSMEKMDLKTLRISDDNIPYCMVKGGKFKARFSRKSYYQLAEYIEQSEDEKKFYIKLNGAKYYINKN